MFEIEDQYSANRTKGSRPSRNVKTHARNADERELVHFPVERVSRASASPATLVWQEIVKKDTQRVVARLRPAILGPIFIIVYEQLNSRQLPCTRRFSIRQPVAAGDTRAFVPIPSFLLNHQWNSDRCRLSYSHVRIRII